jgi:hypothetical protein
VPDLVVVPDRLVVAVVVVPAWVVPGPGWLGPGPCVVPGPVVVLDPLVGPDVLPGAVAGGWVEPGPAGAVVPGGPDEPGVSVDVEAPGPTVEPGGANVVVVRLSMFSRFSRKNVGAINRAVANTTPALTTTMAR